MGDREAIARMFDRWATKLLPRQFAMRRMHRADTGEQTGRRDAERAADRDAPGMEPFGTCGERCTASRVIAARCRITRGIDLIEAVAAETGHAWLDHAECERNRHRRVHRIAAGTQRVETGLGRQRVVGAHRAVAAHDQNAVIAGRKIHGRFQFSAGGS